LSADGVTIWAMNDSPEQTTRPGMARRVTPRQHTMSLKAFNIVFVTASDSAGVRPFGVWSLLDYQDHGNTADAGWRFVSVLAGFALIIYDQAILRKP